MNINCSFFVRNSLAMLTNLGYLLHFFLQSLYFECLFSLCILSLTSFFSIALLRHIVFLQWYVIHIYLCIWTASSRCVNQSLTIQTTQAWTPELLCVEFIASYYMFWSFIWLSSGTANASTKQKRCYSRGLPITVSLLIFFVFNLVLIMT